MSNLVGLTSATLDGIMQAPGRPDEDPVLGSGRRLLADDGPLATLRPADSATTTTGVLVATHQPTRTDGGYEHPRSERERVRSGS
jgi:hypothetical protein